MLKSFALGALVFISFSITAFSNENFDSREESLPFFENEFDHEHEEDIFGELINPFACIKATKEQITVVNQGNAVADAFLKACYQATANSHWCKDLMRTDPHPTNRQIFSCTYGYSQPYRLIHPGTSTWKNAFQGVNLIRELEAKGISVIQIYNWWRPEPYNKNIGGAPTRHPYGTAVDVQFSTMNDMEKAHKILCGWRAQGRLRALGYYGTRELHFGINDSIPNTWGKSCSRE